MEIILQEVKKLVVAEWAMLPWYRDQLQETVLVQETLCQY